MWSPTSSPRSSDNWALYMPEPRIDILLSEIKKCGVCTAVIRALVCEEIADGATKILTNFIWRCGTCGHEEPAEMPELYVDARRSVEQQVHVQQGRIYGEG